MHPLLHPPCQDVPPATSYSAAGTKSLSASVAHRELIRRWEQDFPKSGRIESSSSCEAETSRPLPRTTEFSRRIPVGGSGVTATKTRSPFPNDWGRMVGLVRFELTTSCTPCKRATRLRYSPNKEGSQSYTVAGEASVFSDDFAGVFGRSSKGTRWSVHVRRSPSKKSHTSAVRLRRLGIGPGKRPSPKRTWSGAVLCCARPRGPANETAVNVWLPFAVDAALWVPRLVAEAGTR